jgi:hypothetical protein
MKPDIGSESGSGDLLASSKIDGNKPKREKRGREEGEKAAVWKRCVGIL